MRCASQSTAAAATAGSGRDYASSIEALNRLQSNAALLEQVVRERDSRRHRNVPEMLRLCRLIGVDQPQLDRLRVVHVSGTKGKGSTAAFVECILRQHGRRTGFFSSPHLVEVRERIRIDGAPVSREMFSRYFWIVHDRLTESGENPMPGYFQFLTLMAVKTFLMESVDVAILEVGIGGRYDSTNFVERPWVCAITSLGYDHVSLLGNTLAQIADQKAGILKAGCVGVTVPQPEDGEQVLATEAQSVGCHLFKAPQLQELHWEDEILQQLLGRLQSYKALNAALAVQVCRLWLLRAAGQLQDWLLANAQQQQHLQQLSPFSPSREFSAGLLATRWPGRCTELQHRGCTFYVDGAHTPESVPLAADWFLQRQQLRRHRRLALVFNRTGDRRPEQLMESLARLPLHLAIFCPNSVSEEASNSQLLNRSVSSEAAARCVEENQRAFESLSPAVAAGSCSVLRLPSTASVVDWLAANESDCGVLVTGSIHLVGCVLAVLRPDIAEAEAEAE